MNSNPIIWLLPDIPTKEHLLSLEVLIGIVEESADTPEFFNEYLRLYCDTELPEPPRNSIEAFINNSILQTLVNEFGSGFVKFVYHSVYLTMPDSAFKFNRKLLIQDDWTNEHSQVC